MDFGKLRHRITLQRPGTAANVLGEVELNQNSEWSDYLNLWAAVSPLTSNEIVRTRQAQLDTTHRVNIRYRDGITSNMRIRWVTRGQTHYLAIKGIVNVNARNEELELSCVETTAG